MEPEEPEEPALFSSEELTRIYREEAEAAAAAGDRLKVLLAPYSGPERPRTDD